MSWLYATARPVFRLSLRLFFGLRIFGAESVPARGGLILASNHASYLDPIVAGSCLRQRQLHFLARSTLFRNPLFGAVIRNVNAHPIVRGAGPDQDWDRYVNLVHSGLALLVFPEGTRTPDGQLQRGRSGFGRLVHLCRAPVYPLYIRGSFEAFPKGRGPRLRPISAYFGPPVEMGDLLDQAPEKRVLRAIADRAMEAIARLQAATAGSQAAS